MISRPPSSTPRPGTQLAVFLCLLAFPAACKKKPAATPAPVPFTLQSTAPDSAAPALPAPALPAAKITPLELVTTPLDGSIALQRARTLCTLGSRAYSTPGHQQTLAYLRSELTRLGWKATPQTFATTTPAGPRTYTNLIATWPGNPAPSEVIILTAHYDAPASSFTTFPAASAGAAGCGVLLELAERLKIAPDLAARLQLVFFDGEEPVQQTSATDGLYGSRFFLHSLGENGQLARIRALLAFGAIGHAAAHWTLPTLTSFEVNQALQTRIFLEKWVDQSAPLERPAWGPHLPALQAGLPATYLHDALYPALGTADDTPDRLSAESLRRAALASLQLLQLPPTRASAPTNPK